MKNKTLVIKSIIGLSFIILLGGGLNYLKNYRHTTYDITKVDDVYRCEETTYDVFGRELTYKSYPVIELK